MAFAKRKEMRGRWFDDTSSQKRRVAEIQWFDEELLSIVIKMMPCLNLLSFCWAFTPKFSAVFTRGIAGGTALGARLALL